MTGKPLRAPARPFPNPAARPQLPAASAKALAEACVAADAEIPGHLDAQLGAQAAPAETEPAPSGKAEANDKPAPAAKAAATKDA